MPPPIEPGQVFYLTCQTCTKPKPKFFVVATVTPNLRCFLINSNPSPAQAKNPDLMAALIPVLDADHPFLKWNSYLALTDLIGEYSEADLLTKLAQDPSVYRGTLHANVVAAVKASLPHNKVLQVNRIKEVQADWVGV
jgi:hypothetical protein